MKLPNGKITKSYRELSLHFNASLPRNNPEKWPDGPWTQVIIEPTLPPLDEYKRSAKARINAEYETLANEQANYPWFERKTWIEQEQEALAYIAWVDAGFIGAKPATPVLSAINDARAIGLAELSRRVIENATAWRAQACAWAGERQARCDRVDAATTHAEVDAA